MARHWEKSMKVCTVYGKDEGRGDKEGRERKSDGGVRGRIGSW
jgi:hypothetical protein